MPSANGKRTLHWFIDGYDLPGEHKALWHWLVDRADDYPAAEHVEPLKRLKRETQPAPLGALVTEWYRAGAGDGATLLAAHYVDDTEQWSYDPSEPECSTDLLVAKLLRKRNRGRLIIVQDGATVMPGLASLVSTCVVPLGYSAKPLSARGTFNALLVGKNKCTWKFAGDTSVFGSTVAEMLSSYRAGEWTTHSAGANPATALYQQATTLGALLLTRLGTALMPTLGMAAVRALKQSLAPDVRKWRCQPLLRTMLQEGGGYRGGLGYAKKFTGYAEKADISLAYTSALSEQLPLRAELGECVHDGNEQCGLYVCSVGAPSRFPVNVPQWSTDDGRPSVAPVGSGSGTAILHSAELPGLRSLGIEVEPRLGFVYRETFTLDALRTSILDLVTEYGRSSVEGKLAKSIGNAVYGKTGEDARRESWLIAKERPGEAWWPALDETGEVIANCWETTIRAARSHQHVDIAATLTAHIRSKVWAAIGALLDAGETVYHVIIDSVIASGGVEAALRCVNWEAGAWRYEGACTRSAVAGIGRYEHRGKQRAAGIHNPPPELISRLAEGTPVLLREHVGVRPAARGVAGLHLGPRRRARRARPA